MSRKIIEFFLIFIFILEKRRRRFRAMNSWYGGLFNCKLQRFLLSNLNWSSSPHHGWLNSPNAVHIISLLLLDHFKNIVKSTDIRMNSLTESESGGDVQILLIIFVWIEFRETKEILYTCVYFLAWFTHLGSRLWYPGIRFHWKILKQESCFCCRF